MSYNKKYIQGNNKCYMNCFRATTHKMGYAQKSKEFHNDNTQNGICTK